jgi:dTDP-4-dehydrorhamnose reductase
MQLGASRMVVLGPGGMLGQMVCRYFAGRVGELVCFSERFGFDPPGVVVRKLLALRPDMVINCVGKFERMPSDGSGLYLVNAVLPLELRIVLPEQTVIVHPSTDGVFSGKGTRPYAAIQPADAEDAYGWSKHLGEQALLGRGNTVVLRTSLIGPDKRPEGAGLLNWFLRQPDGAVLKGFTNHWWNGITTLEWCRQVETMLQEDLGSGARLVQLGTANAISKDGLLRLFAEIFGKSVRIDAHEAAAPVNRVLLSQVTCRPIREQLEELQGVARNFIDGD